MEPFNLIPLASPRAVDKAWGEDADENAYIELHNLIAAANGPNDFGPADLRRISKRHGVNLAKSFVAERRKMYRDFLYHLIDRARFDSEGRRTLAHLGRTLHLRAYDLRPIHKIVFGVEAIRAVEDGHLDREEALLLFKLQHALNLDPELAGKAYDTIASDQLNALIHRALRDGVLTLDEVKEIRAAHRSLGVQVPRDFRAGSSRVESSSD